MTRNQKIVAVIVAILIALSASVAIGMSGKGKDDSLATSGSASTVEPAATEEPEATQAPEATAEPTEEPEDETEDVVATATPKATAKPVAKPTTPPTVVTPSTAAPTAVPTAVPTAAPTAEPTAAPTATPAPQAENLAEGLTNDSLSLTMGGAGSDGDPVTPSITIMDKETQSLERLTDGVYGSGNILDGNWNGTGERSLYYEAYRNVDRAITIDLGQVSNINEISIHMQQANGWGISAPAIVNYYLSEDGENYHRVGRVYSGNAIEDTDPNHIYVEEVDGGSPIECKSYYYTLGDLDYNAQYVRVSFELIGTWAFADELEVSGTATPNDDAAELPDTPDTDYDIVNSFATTEQSNGIQHEHLAYGGWYLTAAGTIASTEKTVDQLVPVVGYVDENGDVVGKFFDSVTFLNHGLVANPETDEPNDVLYYTHRSEITASDKPNELTANKGAWQAWLDFMFDYEGTDGAEYNLDALEEAVGIVKEATNDDDYKVGVKLAFYPPIAAEDDWGMVDGIDHSLNFCVSETNSAEQALADRIAASKWYVDTVIATFEAKGYENIRFDGFYYYDELIQYASDALATDTVTAVNDYIHSLDYQIYWIPFYQAAGFRAWKELGFDYAIMQPNYAFDNTASSERIEDTVDLAYAYGLGIEMEFGGISDSYIEKFKEYLTLGADDAFGYQNDSLVGWYTGTWGTSETSENVLNSRYIYDAMYQFYNGEKVEFEEPEVVLPNLANSGNVKLEATTIVNQDAYDALDLSVLTDNESKGNWGDGSYVQFNANNCISGDYTLTADLEGSSELTNIALNFIAWKAAGVNAPDALKFSISADGENWTDVADLTIDDATVAALTFPDKESVTYAYTFETATKARYIRAEFTNSYDADDKIYSWIGMDEFTVNGSAIVPPVASGSVSNNGFTLEAAGILDAAAFNDYELVILGDMAPATGWDASVLKLNRNGVAYGPYVLTRDLGATLNIDSVTLSTVENLGWGIGAPEEVTFDYSVDGETWTKLTSIAVADAAVEGAVVTYTYAFDAVDAAYIRASFQSRVDNDSATSPYKTWIGLGEFTYTNSNGDAVAPLDPDPFTVTQDDISWTVDSKATAKALNALNFGLLTDGATGAWNAETAMTLIKSTYAGPFTVTRELAATTSVESITANFLSWIGAGVSIPDEIVYSVSLDGKSFTKVGTVADVEQDASVSKAVNMPITLTLDDAVDAKYIRIEFDHAFNDIKNESFAWLGIDEFACEGEIAKTNLALGVANDDITLVMEGAGTELDPATKDVTILEKEKRSVSRLTDGKYGNGAILDGAWSGTGERSLYYEAYRNIDRNITVDLGQVSNINELSFHMQEGMGWGIAKPISVTYYLSDDGETFHRVGVVADDDAIKDTDPEHYYWESDSIECQSYYYTLGDLNYNARYVKVSFELIGTWAFADELEVLGTAVPSADADALPDTPGSDYEIVGEYASTDLSNGIQHEYLAYAGYYQSTQGGSVMNTSEKTVDELVATVGYVDDYGKVTGTFFDSVTFLSHGYVEDLSTPDNDVDINYLIYHSGHDNHADKLDWQTWLNFIFDYEGDKNDGKNYNMDALEEAVGIVKDSLGADYDDYTVGVKVAVYPPVFTQDDWGMVDGIDHSLNFAVSETNSEEQALADRLAASKWYIDTVIEMFNAKGYTNITLDGFYYYDELVRFDTDSLAKQSIQDITGYVHSLNDYQIYWIPYYQATGFRAWKDLGMDYAILQPGYSFTTTVGEERMDATTDLAKKYGLGFEMELGGLNEAYAERFKTYLLRGSDEDLRYQNNAVLGWYTGTWATYEASQNVGGYRWIYDAMYDFFKGEEVVIDDEKEWVPNLAASGDLSLNPTTVVDQAALDALKLSLLKDNKKQSGGWNDGNYVQFTNGTAKGPYDLIVDLKGTSNLTKIALNFITWESAGVGAPDAMTFSTSLDGETWTDVATMAREDATETPALATYKNLEYICDLAEAQEARYIRAHFDNGYGYNGNPEAIYGWLGMDEFTINGSAIIPAVEPGSVVSGDFTLHADGVINKGTFAQQSLAVLGDDKMATGWDTSVFQLNTFTLARGPFVLVRDLKETLSLEAVTLNAYRQFSWGIGSPDEVSFEYSVDGETWTALGSVTMDTATWLTESLVNYTYSFEPVDAAYIRATFNAEYDEDKASYVSWLGLGEFGYTKAGEGALLPTDVTATQGNITIKTALGTNLAKLEGFNFALLEDGETGAWDDATTLRFNKNEVAGPITVIRDLGVETDIAGFNAGFVDWTGSGVMPPEAVTFSVSADGETWTEVATLDQVTENSATAINVDYVATLEAPVAARYVSMNFHYAMYNETDLCTWLGLSEFGVAAAKG